MLCVEGFVGSTLDAAAFAYLKKLDTCTNQVGEVYGDETYATLSNICMLGNPEYDCVCVRGETDTDCYGFYLSDR
jgi:hypothetical protein